MSMIPKAFIQDLLQRLRASEVIGQYVALKAKPGNKEYSGLCPFHNEKTPSFTVSDAKQFYHCFGCGAHGDIVRFLMEKEGLRYTEAIERLADRLGLAIPKPSKQEQEREDRREKLLRINRMAQEWFSNMLYQPEGKEARTYLYKRGLSDDIIRHFRLGFAPKEGRLLVEYLQKQHQVTLDNLRDVGLIVERPGKSVYSKFRQRVMFPILDLHEQVIAFGGRILGDGEPKYLNSPETELFHKKQIVYAAPHIRKHVTEAGKVLVVEGYMDVIALYMGGFRYAVAPLGTAYTLEQNQLLRHWTDQQYLCFDGDNAGQRAMERAMAMLLPDMQPNQQHRFVTLPQGLDPDDVIKQQGTQAMEKLLARAHSFDEALWQQQLAAYSSHHMTPEQFVHLQDQLMSKVEQIQHKNLQYHYKGLYRQKLKQYWQEHLFKRFGRQQEVTKSDRKVDLAELDTIGKDTWSWPGSTKPTLHSTLYQEHVLLLSMLIWEHPYLLDESEVLHWVESVEVEQKDTGDMLRLFLDTHMQGVEVTSWEEILANPVSGMTAEEAEGLIAFVAQSKRLLKHQLFSEAHRQASKATILQYWQMGMLDLESIRIREDYERFLTDILSISQEEADTARHQLQLSSFQEELQQVEQRRLELKKKLEFV